MSGPKTCGYRIRAAHRRELARQQTEERKRREELAARVAAAQKRLLELEKRSARLANAIGELRSRFPSEKFKISVPSITAAKKDDVNALEAAVSRLEGECIKTENAVRNAGEQAQANQDFRAATRKAAELCAGTVRTAEEAMRNFVESIAVTTSRAELVERQKEIDRILGRFATKEWQEVSPQLESLVIEALSAKSKGRFAALATEIRLQVQEGKRLQMTRKANADRAKSLLDSLDREIPKGADALKQQLELVRVGAIPLTEDIESLVRSELSNAAEAARQQLQASATNIVRGTLADLGYDVAPIEETLFARGGKVYFRKKGWKDYCVRLTVRPDENKMNFNVVRIADRADEDRSSSRQADLEVESAWCSGFEELLDQLKERGLEMQLTRRLPVGGVPVPLVGSDEVPVSAFIPPTKKQKENQAKKLQKGSHR